MMRRGLERGGFEGELRCGCSREHRTAWEPWGALVRGVQGGGRRGWAWCCPQGMLDWSAERAGSFHPLGSTSQHLLN